jgi:NADP-dependent 3-hydroxy acid dehydrogenase YdfG
VRPVLLFISACRDIIDDINLANNAGFVLGVEHVGDINPDDIEAMFGANVFGLIAVTQLFVKGSWSSYYLDRHRISLNFCISIRL